MLYLRNMEAGACRTGLGICLNTVKLFGPSERLCFLQTLENLQGMLLAFVSQMCKSLGSALNLGLPYTSLLHCLQVLKFKCLLKRHFLWNPIPLFNHILGTAYKSAHTMVTPMKALPKINPSTFLLSLESCKYRIQRNEQSAWIN